MFLSAVQHPELDTALPCGGGRIVNASRIPPDPLDLSDPVLFECPLCWMLSGTVPQPSSCSVQEPPKAEENELASAQVLPNRPGRNAWGLCNSAIMETTMLRRGARLL